MSVLLLDNRDSFTENLAAAFSELTRDVTVRRTEHVSVDEVLAKPPGLVVLGPGPGRPEQAPGLSRLAQQLKGQVPILGICLGHQVLLHNEGARIVHAHKPRHGKADPIEHDTRGLFEGLTNPLTAMRYHSLVANTAPPPFFITATDDHRQIMAVRAPRHRLWGVQFHPESIGTEGGLTLLANALDLAGVTRQKVVHRPGGIPPQRPTRGNNAAP